MAYDEMSAAIQGICDRLDTLASINTDNILIPGGSQEHYHQIVEEAYVVLGLIETLVDELRSELEYQHKRLDEARDAALAELNKQQPAYNQEQAIRDYTCLIEAGPLTENEEELRALIEQAYAHNMYFDYDRDKHSYVLRHGEAKE
jgi:hypothetical protein